MYGNLMTPTFVDKVGSKNKLIGVQFLQSTKRPPPSAFPLTRRLWEARRQLYQGI